MNALLATQLETDSRFPSGAWTGFWLQCWMPGRNMMTLDLDFINGQMQAKGSDIVGPFTFRGTYDVADRKCQWIKQYVGQHQVSYTGVNEGQGIWGVWEIRLLGGLYKDQGVFHIWPEGMTPSEEAEQTVEAYLSHMRSRWPKRLVGPILLGALALAISYLLHFWSRTP